MVAAALGFFGALSVLGVIMGVATKSVSVGLTIPVALYAVVAGIQSADEGRIARFYLWSGSGSLLLFIGMVLSSGRGGLLWAAMWAIVGVFCVLAALVKSYDPDYRHVGALGVVSLIIAGGSPFLVHLLDVSSASPSTASWLGNLSEWFKPAPTQTADAWGRIFSAFMQRLFGTPGGWLSIVIATALGWTWGRRKGALIALGALIAGPIALASVSSETATTISMWLAMGPVERLAVLLDAHKLALLDAPAASIALVFIGLSLALGGAIRMTADGMLAIVEAPTDTHEMNRRFPEVARGLAAAFLMAIVVTGALIALWIALRRLGAAEALYAFPGAPWNLASNGLSLKTNLPGVILAGINVAVSAATFVRSAFRQGSWWQLLAAVVLATAFTALIAPNGVLLASLLIAVVMNTFGRMLTADHRRRISALRVRVIGGRRPDAEMGDNNLRLIFNRSGGNRGPEVSLDTPRLDEHTPAPAPTPAPTPDHNRARHASSGSRVPQPEDTSTRLLHLDAQILAMTPLIGGGLAVLDSNHTLARFHGDGITASGRVKTVQPLGLVASAEGRVVLVDGAGRLAEYEFKDGSVQMTHACATGPIRCFAGKPFGTQVAYASDTSGISVFTIVEDAATGLVNDVSGVRALAYSLDGRYLCWVTDDADAAVLDLKTGARSDLEMPDSRVERLSASPAGWLAGLEDKRVILWSAGGSIGSAWRLSGAITAMAVCPRDGMVAVGGSRGRVQVRDSALSETLFDGPIARSRIVALSFAEDGLIAGASGGEVLRVSL